MRKHALEYPEDEIDEIEEEYEPNEPDPTEQDIADAEDDYFSQPRD